MKIAIDISPLTNANKIRGVGFYLLNLKKALLKNFKSEDFVFFENKINEKVDAIFYPFFDPFKINFSFFGKTPIIITIHDLTPIVFEKYFPAGIRGNLNWQIQKFLLKKAGAIITDSSSSAKDIANLTGISKHKIHTVYLSAGQEFQQIKDKIKLLNIKKKYNLPDKFGLYVGDVTWNKNLPRIIEAFKKTEIPLIMVGKSLTDENFDRENIWNKDRICVLEKTKNNKQFIKLGFISTEDLVAIYNLATFSITASLYEGFGLPVVEAMACGIPVISSKEGSLSEIGGDAVFYIDAYNINSIRNGIEAVFNDKKLQEKLSKKGWERSCNFSWDKTAEETLKAIKETVK